MDSKAFDKLPGKTALDVTDKLLLVEGGGKLCAYMTVEDLREMLAVYEKETA